MSELFNFNNYESNNEISSKLIETSDSLFDIQRVEYKTNFYKICLQN